jgi:hypothetical protein
MLNSNGQDCWLPGAALMQEIWSRPSAFIRATKLTGKAPFVPAGGGSADLMIV